MNPHIEQLHSYPFEKLALLKAGITPPAHLPHIALSIGEPKHEPPAFALEAIANNLELLRQYPVTSGTEELRQACAQWCEQRFDLPNNSVKIANVLSVNGTREALFAFAQAVVDNTQESPVIISPNPFYQIYEGAALLAGAEPYYLNCREESGYLPNLDEVPEEIWLRCQLLYLCTPGNPTGAIAPLDYLVKLIELSDRYNFVIASDECYSEIYFDYKPAGVLQACASMGRMDFKNCVIFQSLSKRSNLPGLRSGFVAGDAAIIAKFLKYRTYHGCAMPMVAQKASAMAWQDESHVEQNRDAYRQKFSQVLPLLQTAYDVQMPDAAFFFWLKTPIDDQEFAQRLFAEQNVTVLPGSYLARESNGVNPGTNYVRIAMVADLDECVEAAQRLVNFAKTLQ